MKCQNIKIQNDGQPVGPLNEALVWGEEERGFESRSGPKTFRCQIELYNNRFRISRLQFCIIRILYKNQNIETFSLFALYKANNWSSNSARPTFQSFLIEVEVGFILEPNRRLCSNAFISYHLYNAMQVANKAEFKFNNFRTKPSRKVVTFYDCWV